MSLEKDDPSLMFGPAGAQLPAISKMAYDIETRHGVNDEAPQISGKTLNVKMKLAGTDIIGGLLALYRSGAVPRPYPRHVQQMACLGRTHVTVKAQSVVSSRAAEDSDMPSSSGTAEEEASVPRATTAPRTTRRRR